MIVILKRDDLPQEHHDLAVKDLELNFSGLPVDLVDRAELIVFMEGSNIKFLKHFSEFHSQDSLDVLINYITSIGPTNREVVHFSKKRVRRLKKID